MEALFLKLVNMSITASWLVLAIIVVRLIFKKAPKWILCLLWGLVAFRLICPFSIESAMSLIPSAEPLPQEIIYTAEPQIHSGVTVIDNAVNPVLESSMTPAELTSANPTQIWSFILSQVWILGMVLMFAYTLVSYLLLKRKVATAIPLVKGIKQSEYVDSPFVLGIIRPVIYLPFSMEEGDMAYVIAHETAHIRRRDHWWKPFGFLLLSVYWFNPILWVAYILLCRDIEAACDEKVIKDMKLDDRRVYSTALLNCSIHRRRIAACPLAFGEVGVKTRVKGIMNYKKPTFWVILVAVIICIIVSACLLTNPAGMYLDDINDSRNYLDLFMNIEEADMIHDGSVYPVYDVDGLVEQFSQVRIRKFPVIRNRSEERDKTYQIQLRRGTYVNFSRDFSRVWIDNGMKPTYTYLVIDRTEVKEAFESFLKAPPVVIWFDNYTGDTRAVGRHSDGMKYPGIPDTTMHYTENYELVAETAAGREVVLSGVPLWNVYFTDLSGDDVPELCASASRMEDYYYQFIMALDPVTKEWFTLSDDASENYGLEYYGQLLVSRRLRGFQQSVGYGGLQLVNAGGGNGRRLEIVPLDSSYDVLQKTVACVDVQTRKHTCLSSAEEKENALSLLRGLEKQVEPASWGELTEEQQDPFFQIYVIINYELGSRSILFTNDFRYVWENGSDEIYRVTDPDPIRKFVEAVTDGVRDKETAGEPFATMDVPWDWCRGVDTDTVSTAEIYVCLEADSSGNTSWITATNGFLSSETLRKLISVLNQIPENAFSPDRILHSWPYEEFRAVRRAGTCSISIVDGVNDLAVSLRSEGDTVEILLTDEVDKVLDYEGTYLKPTQVWKIDHEALLEVMKQLAEDPQVIQYTVGAEYEWQKPVSFRTEGFSLDLRLIEGWEYEEYSDRNSSGIRCRPADVEEGWIYFSFWPERYEPKEENRYISQWNWNNYPSETSWPSDVESPDGFSIYGHIWSYQKYSMNSGDFAIINDGADSWFLEYQDQIENAITLSTFTEE